MGCEIIRKLHETKADQVLKVDQVRWALTYTYNKCMIYTTAIQLWAVS